MPFIVETGAGVASANAYSSVAAVTTYLTDRARQDENAWSTATSTAQEAAIVAATDYVEKRFASRWIGQRGGTTQGLSWPRTLAVDSTGLALADDAVPTLLLRAIAEYSVRAYSSVLLPDPTRGASGSSGVVQRLKEKVGPIETDTTYAVAEGGAVQATIAGS